MIPKYYEFLNKSKILSGYRAIENIAHELKTRGSNRPMILTHSEIVEKGILKVFLDAMNGSELVIGSVFQCSKPISPQCVEQAVSEFKACSCDAIIALGGDSSFILGKAIGFALLQGSGDDILLMGPDCVKKSLPAPFIIVPVAYHALEITGDPDVIVLDPRLTMRQPPHDTVVFAMDTVCHAIETYTGLQKNPLSDAYAFSAITLVRENLPKAVNYERERKSSFALVNAALLSSIAFMNSQAGIAHALVYGLEERCKVTHEEVIGIILPHCMETNMIELDEYYGELLLPLVGPEIYADTPQHERGRKTVQAIRNMLSEYHEKYGIPICLSEVGVKRSDFDVITDLCLKSRLLLYNPTEVREEDIRNILNLAF